MVKCELEEVEFGLSVICKVLDFFQFVIKFVESDYGSYKFFVLFKFYVFCYMDDNRDDCIFLWILWQIGKSLIFYRQYLIWIQFFLVYVLLLINFCWFLRQFFV